MLINKNTLVSKDRIPSLFYGADCRVKEFMVKGITSHNERSYMGAFAHDIGIRLKEMSENDRRLTVLESEPLFISVNVRDTGNFDGLFVFNFDSYVKVGVCESKVLRESKNLNKWDYKHKNWHRSHFSNQLFKYSKWKKGCAVWCMFINDMPDGNHSGFFNVGSTCFWLNDMLSKYDNFINPSRPWCFQDLYQINKDRRFTLFQIIKDIIDCNRGTKLRSDGMGYVEIPFGQNPKKVPLPTGDNNREEFSSKCQYFLKSNGLKFYWYLKVSDILRKN